MLALAAVLALCAALPALFQQSRAIETGSWGLSFRTEGKAPVGNASAEALRRYDAVYLGNEAEQKIYLTFDAGYENGCTEPILDALAKHNVKAAFFVVGNYIEQNPDLVRRMLREGHLVGNHTYHHYCHHGRGCFKAHSCRSVEHGRQYGPYVGAHVPGLRPYRFRAGEALLTLLGVCSHLRVAFFQPCTLVSSAVVHEVFTCLACSALETCSHSASFQRCPL